MENLSKELDNLSGAAVRGEAVAESVADLREFHELAMDYRGAVAFTTAPTAYKRLCAFVDARVAAAKVSARAADAPSEPSELIELLRSIRPNYGTVGSRDIEVTAMRKKIDSAITILSGRAADALDSQPTDFEDRPLKARVLRNELAIIIGCQDGRSGQEKADAVLSWIEKQGQYVFAPAATQPTVAAQQGSIAHDPDFLWLMMGITGIDTAGDNFKRLVAYIDSRASSAPVAPIAPDGWISVKDQMPKSGQRVLFGWINSLGNWRTSTGNWNARFTEESTSIDEDACEYNEADDTHYLLEGWNEWGWELEFSAYVTDPVTHWMPLPPAPQQEGSEAGNG